MSAREVILDSVFTLLLATDLIGNSLVFLVIVRNQTMKTAMNYLLLNLAIADILVGLFLAPNFLLMPMADHPTGAAGDVLCKIVTGKNICWLASLASGFTLVLVSLERFYATRYPLAEHKINKKKLAFLLPVVWLLSFALTLPSFLDDKFNEISNDCDETIERRDWQGVLYALTWLIFGGIGPVSVMSTLYSMVIYFFRSITNDGIAPVVLRSRKKVSVMVITISLIYAICILPTHIIYCVFALEPGRFSNDRIAFPSTYILFVLNSAVNPFVYIFQCAEFRKCVKKLLCCRGGGNGRFLHETVENTTVMGPMSEPPAVPGAETLV